MRQGPILRRNRSIEFYLVTLVMLAVVPLMLIAGLLIWRQSLLQREVFDRSLLQTAQALSVAVDRQLSAERVMLETLAQSALIDSGDIPAFHALCTRVITKRGGLFISLFDERGTQIFNTLRPPGSPRPRRSPIRRRRIRSVRRSAIRRRCMKC